MRKINTEMLRVMDPNGTIGDNLEETASEKSSGTSNTRRGNNNFGSYSENKQDSNMQLLELLSLEDEEQSLGKFVENLVAFCTKHGYVADRYLPSNIASNVVSEEYGETSMSSGELLLLSCLPELYSILKSVLCIHHESEKTGNHQNKYYAISYGEEVYEFHRCTDGKYTVSSNNSLLDALHPDENAQYFFCPAGNISDYSGNYYVFPTKVQPTPQKTLEKK